MVSPAGNRPVIFLGHEDYLALTGNYQQAGGNPDTDVFEPRTFFLGDWIRLFSLASHQVIDFMMEPLDPSRLQRMWDTNDELLLREVKGTDQLSIFLQEDPLTRMLRNQREDEAVRIDGVSYDVLRSFISNLPHLPPLFFRVKYNPMRHDLQAHVRLLRGHGAEPEDIAAQMVQSGTWAFSSISGFDLAVTDQLTHPKIPSWLAEGARILVVATSHNLLARPEFLPMGLSDDGKKIEFWRPRRPGAAAEGAQMTLIHSRGLLERFNIKQIVKLVQRAVETARRAGKKPVVVFDIDGTVANARGFTRRVFEEFIDMYGRLVLRTSGVLPDITIREDELPRDDIQAALRSMGVHDREILGLAQGYLDFKKRESPTNDYDVQAALSEFIAVYNTITLETAQELKSTYERYKLTHEPSAWNNVEMLRTLGITDQNLLAFAAAHFERNFFSSVRRLDKDPIDGTVQLIRLLQQRYPDLVTVSLTLRDSHDDNLPDGRSSSKVWFQRVGIWNENSVLLRLEKRSFIDFSAEAFKAGGNEPNKGDLLLNYLKENPGAHPIMILENDPRHSNGYQDLFPYQVLVVRVDAKDAPPYSPEDSNGIFVFSADQLREALQETLPPEIVETLNRNAISIEGPAWEPMMARWHAAVAAGIQPVVIFDIDDTLMMTSNRTRTVLENFLKDVWIPSHPEHGWALDVITGFTLSQVEYGIPATLRASGLDGLGAEFEKAFTSYFLKNFLSNALLGEDLPRLSAVSLVRKLHAMGTRIIYLTGRTRDDMADGTMAALWDTGFPLDDKSAVLVMREDHQENDFAFKTRVLKETVGSGALIAFYDNEPENLRRAIEIAPGVAVYLVGDKHTPDAPEPPVEAINIANFTGEIGPPPPRQKPMLGEELRRAGEKTANDLIHLLTSINSDQQFMYGYGADFTDRIEASIRPKANDAEQILLKLIALHPSHPAARSFIATLNKFILREKSGIIHLEDLLHLVNWRVKRHFTTLQGPEGIERIVDASKGIPPDWRPAPPPPTFGSGRISLEGAMSYSQLAGQLMEIPAGPNLTDVSQEFLFNALAFDVYPRLEAVFKTIISDIVRRLGIKPEMLHAIEYGPRRAIAAISTLRRMGVDVAYRDPAVAHQFQTEAELARLHPEIRAGVQHIPSEEAASADIAIWNLPTTAITFDQMTTDLRNSESQTGQKILVVQSEQAAGQQLLQTATQQGWAPIISMQLPPQQYIMPTAFMHVTAPAAPLMFQAFQLCPML